jgi:type IV pilus assembly protein PilW
VLQGGAADGFITTGSSGLLGFKGTGTGFSPALPTVFDRLGTAALPGSTAPLPTSDVVSVRVPADTVSLGVISAMTTPDSAPQVQPAAPGSTLAQGDIVLIANCESSAIFQVTADDPAATGVLTRAVGAGAARSNTTTNLQKTYRSDATVYRLETRHYYVAPSAVRPGTNSLWRLEVSGALKPADGLKAVEVANGIDRIEVNYGVDNVTPPANVSRYVDATAVADWDRVLSARIQMVAATPDDNMARVQVAAAPDRRLRSNLTEVVTLRNGAP